MMAWLYVCSCTLDSSSDANRKAERAWCEIYSRKNDWELTTRGDDPNDRNAKRM